MELTIDGIRYDPVGGESLLQIVRKLGMDDEKLSRRPLAAKIAGEVFNLNYVPVREKDSGRGFLTGHGYYIHTYGRTNPYYIRARDKYNATHARGRGGGGCACAGGGRAGCSQKDTYSTSVHKHT